MFVFLQRQGQDIKADMHVVNMFVMNIQAKRSSVSNMTTIEKCGYKESSIDLTNNEILIMQAVIYIACQLVTK